jgi:hypothetical protein
MNNLLPIMMVILFLAAGSMLLRTVPAQRAFLKAYRKAFDPPYPLTSDELRDSAERQEASPTGSLGVILGTQGRRFRLYWGAYPKHPELNKLAKSIRSWIMLSIVVFVAGICLILAISYNLSH